MFKLTYLVLFLLTRLTLQTITFDLDLLETGSLDADSATVTINLRDSAVASLNLKDSVGESTTEKISVVLISDGDPSFFIGDSQSVMNVYNQVKSVDKDSAFVSMVQLGVDFETNTFHFLIAIRGQGNEESSLVILVTDDNSTDANEEYNDETQALTLDDRLGPVLFTVIILLFYGCSIVSVMISRIQPRKDGAYNQQERKKGKLIILIL